MPLGIWDVAGGAPGTVRMFDRDTTNDRIHLNPLPSPSGNDPLNWPLWQRDAILVILCFASVMAATLGPILATNTIILVLEYQQSFTGIALLTGFHLCGVGAAGVVCSATARFLGKRSWYLLGAALLVAGSAWAASSTSYTSHLWARVVQGIGVCPFEALVNASVGDLYFVHQRGKRMAFANLALYGATWLTPMITGVLTRNRGWRWPYILVSIFSGLALLLIFFFVPEHVFYRSAAYDVDIAHDHAAAASEKGRLETIPSSRDPYLRRLRPFSGRKTRENVAKLILRPFILFLHPAVLWGCLTMASLISWTIGISVVVAAIFTGPPLWWNEAQVGYVYAAPFVGSMGGFVLAGALSDGVAKFLTRRNHGVFEPEFRLVLSIPMTVFGVAGVYGFGLSYDIRANWIVPVVFFGFVTGGMVLAAVCSAIYIVDAHRDIAVEAFVSLLLFKNFIGFLLTDRVYDWLLQRGVEDAFVIMGSVQVVICALSVPMYIFGKRNRALMQRYNLFRIFHLD